ncbi:MAG: hypothetical protein R6W68_07180 [Ignavibacteriaceae bacterium]
MEKNIFPGDLPKITADYITKIDNLQKELSATTDLEAGREISRQILKLKNEADLELKEYYTANMSNIPIQFNENIKNEFYEIQTIIIKNIRFNEIELAVRVNTLDQIKNSQFLYMKFADKNGNEIPGWIVMILPPGNSNGGISEFSGTYIGIENLVNADMLIIKTREEYENSTSLNY